MPNEPKFADKFSKFKLKFLVIFWIVTICILLNIFSSLFYSLYSITKFKESYFAIDIMTDNHALYTRMETPPPSWVKLSKISKRIQQAIISSEDGLFYLHPGYDLEQLRDAINDSFVLKKKMRGASTITQQLVKNLYLDKEKTFGRKFRELIMTIMIEKYADKEKILESYLNIIEFGKKLYGIGNASQYYFKKKPADLNSREAAFLAMLLPSPVRYSKSFQNKVLTRFANRTVNSILLKMRQSGYISEEEYETQLEGHFAWEKVLNEDDLSSSTIDEELIDESTETE